MWSEADNRVLIGNDFPWYLEIIMLVNLDHYFIVLRHRWIYESLDFECFRSLDTLLTGCVVASGCEPQAHQRNDRVVPGD